MYLSMESLHDGSMLICAQGSLLSNPLAKRNEARREGRVARWGFSTVSLACLERGAKAAYADVSSGRAALE